jgi:hypothetical protein
MNRPELTRLAELRSKTDRQLARLIDDRLDEGLRYARLLADPDSDLHWISTESFPANARKAYAEARSLLPWVRVAGTERRRLESKLEDLRELLDESTIRAEMRVQTACS